MWLDQGGMPSDQPFYETHDWQHSADFHGPFTVPASSRLRFQCDYVNSDANDVFEGPNATTSEMCVFGGLYYPKQTDSFDNCDSLSIVGTGTSTCSEIVACETACAGAKLDVEQCKEKCLVSGCPSAADEFQALSACAEQKCQAECATGHCRECALAQCPTEAQACLSHTCAP